jgi:hypothetical protein
MSAKNRPDGAISLCFLLVVHIAFIPKAAASAYDGAPKRGRT